MTSLNQLEAIEHALESTAPVSASQPASGVRSLFFGPRGLRAGWRSLISIGLLVVLFGGFALVCSGGPQGLRDAQKHLGEVTITPFLMGVLEAISFAILQYTLASGIGFWPAAFVMSGFFAFGHAFNPHEMLVGVGSVVLFGLLLCFFLRRSGSLWCAVGFHAAYAWGQTLFGVPDSGIAPYHNLFNSAFSGPHWLTGGIVGPEASVLTPIALALVVLVFSRCYRENRYPM